MMNMLCRNFPGRPHRLVVRFCGIEPYNRPRNHASFLSNQDTPFSKSKNSGLTVSQSSDLPARCQAAVSVHPLPTRQAQDQYIEVATLKREGGAHSTELPSSEQSPSPFPQLFVAQGVRGHLLECSSRGCRPLLTYSVPENLILQAVQDDAAQVMSLSHTDMYTRSRRGASDMMLRSSKVIDPQPVSIVDKISAAKKAYDAAIQAAPGDAQLLSEFAVFTWKSAGDLDAAEELYTRALKLSPDDTNIMASYALSYGKAINDMHSSAREA